MTDFIRQRLNPLEAKPLFLAGGTPRAYLFAHKQRPAKCFWVPRSRVKTIQVLQAPAGQWPSAKVTFKW